MGAGKVLMLIKNFENGVKAGLARSPPLYSESIRYGPGEHFRKPPKPRPAFMRAGGLDNVLTVALRRLLPLAPAGP